MGRLLHCRRVREDPYPVGEHVGESARHLPLGRGTSEPTHQACIEHQVGAHAVTGCPERAEAVSVSERLGKISQLGGRAQVRCQRMRNCHCLTPLSARNWTLGFIQKRVGIHMKRILRCWLPGFYNFLRFSPKASHLAQSACARVMAAWPYDCLAACARSNAFNLFPDTSQTRRSSLECLQCISRRYQGSKIVCRAVGYHLIRVWQALGVPSVLFVFAQG